MTISTKILEFSFGKPILDNSKWAKIIMVGIGVSTPPSKTPPLFLVKSPPLNQQTFQPPSPLFRQSPRIYWFFKIPPKTRIFEWTPKILKFFVLNTIVLNIFAYKFFLSLNISDFNLFLCENCNPRLIQVTPSSPATPSKT